MLKQFYGNFAHAQLRDLTNMAKDADFLHKDTLIFMWLTVSLPNSDGWSVVTSGGAEFKDSLDIQILERNLDEYKCYKISHNGQTFILTLREVINMMNDLCKQRGLDRYDLIATSLNKYF